MKNIKRNGFKKNRNRFIITITGTRTVITTMANTTINGLRLVVKDEVIGTLIQREILEDIAGKRSIATVVLGELAGQ